MLLSFIEKINRINELIFCQLDSFIETLPIEDWIIDAIVDSVHLIPFLFFIFVVIEFLEFYFSDKLDLCIKKAKKRSVTVGALASIFPQCGFSVIASSLYTKNMITKGCLIAVYLGTSDETIPILLVNPDKAYLIIPIVGLKLFIAIFCGYLIDIISGQFKTSTDINKIDTVEQVLEEGCCNHNPETKNKREIIIHPIQHTINIVTFIFVITLILNYVFEYMPITNLLSNQNHKYIQCIIASLSGLIPNCAVSIAITMMLIKGTITFGAAMSGLLSNAGLGLLVLLKKNDFKDTVQIIAILLTISVVAGCIIQNFT